MSVILKENQVHESWKDFINREDIRSELGNIERKLQNETEKYFPENENILRFLQNNLQDVKVVILGMDPYHSSYKEEEIKHPIATGRCFEVSNMDNWQKPIKQTSLVNILKTIYFQETHEKIKDIEVLRKKIRTGEFKIAQPHEWFDNLERQGVLFLNATLTVCKGKADSHKKIWKDFMNSLIKFISTEKPNAKWFLWGKKAEERAKSHLKEDMIVKSCHPRCSQFIDSNSFQYVQDVNWLGI